jgi:WD40 repeat protein
VAAAAAGAVIAFGAQALAAGRDPFASRPPRLEGAVASRGGFPVWNLTFSPDGMLLAAGGVDSTSVYNLAAGRRVAALPARSAEITSLAFSPDGRTLTVTTDGATDIQLWDLAARRLEPGLRQPRNHGFYDASYSRDGKFLAASDADGNSTYVWDVATRRPAAVLTFPDTGISPVAFSPDGRTLAMTDGLMAGQGRRHGSIDLWNTAGRTVTGRLHDPGGSQVLAAAWSPGGTTLAAADAHRIYLWDTATRKLSATIKPPPHLILRDLAFSPAGQWLAVLTTGDSVLIWDTGTGKLAATFRSPDGAQVASLAYSPDGRSLAVGDYDGRIYLWNASRLP